MEEYASNSDKAREQTTENLPEKRTTKVVSGPVKTREKSGLQKLTRIFIPEDIQSVKRYIIEDVVVPYFQDIILDAAKAWFNTNGRSGNKKSSTSSRISYREFYDSPGPSRSVPVDRERERRWEDVVLSSRIEADDVLSRMDEILSRYRRVSVADFYDCVGITSVYTDNNYGWTDLSSARVYHVSNGYMIKFPRVTPLQ